MVGGSRQTLLAIVGSATAFGGVPHWLSYLVPGLRQRGWRVVMGLASGPRFHRPASFLNELPFSEDCVRIHTRSCTPESRACAITRTVRRVNPDLVLGINIVDTYEGCRRARLKGWTGKSVQTLHGIEQDYYDDLSALSRHLDALVCTNRLACQLAREWSGFPEKRIHYAPYGVELSVANKPRYNGEKLKLAYSGRLEQQQKRVHDLPALLAALEHRGVDAELLIAGTGPEEEALRQECTGYNVTFLGRLPPEALPSQLYKRADILVIPSSWETGPIVAWEAMASKTVVVSSRYLGHYLENALCDGVNCRLFNIGDTETAADLIAELSRNPQQIAQLQEGGRRLVHARYSRTHSVSTWDHVLTTIAAQTSLPSCRDRITRATSGRLDAWLYPAVAEHIRTLVRQSYSPKGPGDEWPHAYGNQKTNPQTFMNMAVSLDMAAAGHDHA